MPHEESKEADCAYRSACTAGGVVAILDNTSSLSRGVVNIDACPTALTNIFAHNNSNIDDDGSAEREI